jgi:hypothetical protein
MDISHPWPIHDECALTVTRMLNAGRDGMEVRRYVLKCARLAHHQEPAEGGNDVPAGPFTMSMGR